MITEIKNVSNPLLLFKSISKLGKINLLIGGNGVGKTTLLNAIEQKSNTIEITGDISKLYTWKNCKDNHRYNNPSPYASDYNESLISLMFSHERSEGENIAHSFLTWFEDNNEPGAVFLIDEIDSGLSVDSLNGIAHVIVGAINKHDCQFIMSVNSWHLLYVFDTAISLIDGKPIKFNRDYDKFCEFSFSSAKKLGSIREKQRETQRENQKRNNNTKSRQRSRKLNK